MTGPASEDAAGEIVNGEVKVRRIAVAMVAVSLLSIVLLTILSGSDKLIVRGVRFLFTCLLAFYLVRGASWARMVVGVLFVLGAITSILAFLGIESLGLPHFSLLGIWLVLMAIYYLVLAYYLFLDQEVAQHFG